MNILRKFIPETLLGFYHFLLAWAGSLIYGKPSREMTVIGVTGTKGKTTVIEILNAILEEAGHKTAIISSYRFKIGEGSKLNRKGITMPGRLTLQKKLRKAVGAECTHAIVEVTSQGIVQHRHKFIDYDIAVIINLAPEHVEAHSSFEAYRNAKLKLFHELKKSAKDKKIAVLNAADEHYVFFNEQIGALHDVEIRRFDAREVEHLEILRKYMKFMYKNDEFECGIVGEFALEDVLAAYEIARSVEVPVKHIQEALKKFEGVPGRFEMIKEDPYVVIVDYAHTPESLEAVYSTVKRLEADGHLNLVTNYKTPGARMICVLGSTGGGRDTWKWPEMGKIASDYCDELILTSEDPYDEDPREIMKQIRSGINPNVSGTLDVFELVDRRRAIEVAVEHARPGDIVIITGKGSELWMFVGDGKKIPWNDKKTALEAIELKDKKKKKQ